MATRSLDKKYFKQQMNYIVLIPIGNHLLQFEMTFLVRPSTKATQLNIIITRAKNGTLYTKSDPLIKIQNNYKKMFQIDLCSLYCSKSFNYV